MDTRARSEAQETNMTHFHRVSDIHLQGACACGNHSHGEEECAECKKKSETTLQRVALSQSPVQQVPPIVPEALRSPGQPLDAATRRFMEPRLGSDFSHVRLHTDALAAESARAVGALAYTVGRDIVFGASQYAPYSSEGQKLIAHELTHVMQQRNSPWTGEKLEVGAADTAQEREAGKADQWNIATSVELMPVSPGTLQRDATPTGFPEGPPQKPRSLELIPTLPGASQGNCAGIAGDPFSAQPAEFQAVLQESFRQGTLKGDPATWFETLGATRPVLTSIYNRLCQFGLWRHVRAVRYVAAGERPFGPFDVPGNVGSVGFTADDGPGLMKDLLGTFRFCADSPIGGSQHKEQASFREESRSDSMHVAVGPRANFDAHVDRNSSPGGGRGGVCERDPP